MLVKITSKRQVTFPKQVMEKLHLREGDRLSITETSDGFMLRPHRFDRTKLARLRGKFSPTLPGPNIEEIRHAALDSSLRD